MDQNFEIARLLALRTLTTALAENFTRQARAHLANLAPLFQPRSLLGDLIRYEESPVRTQDAAFQRLLKLYEPLARATALNVQTDVKPPLDIFGSTPEIVPASYAYTPQGSSKPLTIVTPLKWVAIYKDLFPQHLKELVASHARSGGSELQACVLHYLCMHLVAEQRPGAASVLEALRFPLASVRNDELAGLPFVYLSLPVSTMRSLDAVIFQGTQISGTTTFEEVVNLRDIAQLSDPLKDQALALAR